MPWTIVVERPARKLLSRFPKSDQARILAAIDVLALDPFAARNVAPLKGRSGYRMRVGDYRVIYRLEKNRLIIVVFDLGQRSGVYD